MQANQKEFERLTAYANDVLTDKTQNTLEQWVADYGGRLNDKTYLEFGSYYALAKMLDRRDKEVVRRVLAALTSESDQQPTNQ